MDDQHDIKNGDAERFLKKEDFSTSLEKQFQEDFNNNNKKYRVHQNRKMDMNEIKEINNEQYR